jgi:hypothetical protein
MKRTLALLAPMMFLCASPATYAGAVGEPAAAVDLCAHKAVREVARLNSELKPVRELYGIATNPTGFVLKQVNDRVIHIPKWVHYAMDPQGALRAKVMEKVREELKKQVGLRHECAEELAGGAIDAPEATTLLPLERDV